MAPVDFEEYLRATPFEPFRIVASTGDTCDIRHPELLMVGRGSVIIGVADEEDQRFFDRTIRLSLFHIVRLEPIERAARFDQNGEP
jgi:hypothetical protein